MTFGLLLRDGPGRVLKRLLDPAVGTSDADRFFGKGTMPERYDEQLSENLLRAAYGELSLQREGLTIPGAMAESDKGAGLRRSPDALRMRASHTSVRGRTIGP
jgi:hypothetical protein